MLIRNAGLNDLPAIVQIYNSTIPSKMVTADTSPVTVEGKMEWFSGHEPAKWPIWVLEYNNHVIGWLSFSPFYNRPAYNATAEISIYIAEGQRGRGIGTKLLTEAIKKAPELGFTSLLGFVFAHNNPSLKLFTKMNFERWGYLPGVACLGEVEKDLVILGRKVGINS